MILLLLHDLMKILKMLALLKPKEPICFTLDNLLIRNGHLILSDAYLSKTKLKRELRLIQDKTNT